MSQPDQAHASVPRARPAAKAAGAPLRVVAERVRPDAVADTVAYPAPTGPAALRAGFRDASAVSMPLAVAPCPQTWPAPPHIVAAQMVGGAAIAAPDLSAPGVVPVGADLVPARSLLPVPACPPRTLLARLSDLFTGRRDPAGRHRPGSMDSPTWSMCTQRRRRSRWRSR